MDQLQRARERPTGSERLSLSRTPLHRLALSKKPSTTATVARVFSSVFFFFFFCAAQRGTMAQAATSVANSLFNAAQLTLSDTEKNKKIKTCLF